MNQSVTLSVEGMTCASCVTRIEKLLKNSPGVEDARVNLASENVSLIFDPSKTDLGRLASSVEEAGYKLVLAPSREVADASPETYGRRQLKKHLVLSIILTVPIILLSMLQMVPSVGAYVNSISRTIDILLLLLTAVVLIIPGGRFFRAGWSAMKHRTADMNLLVSVGTGAAYLYSLYVVFTLRSPGAIASHNLYLDTSSSIITLVLLGRFLEARAKERTRIALRNLLSLQPKTARVNRQGLTIDIPIGDLMKDEVVLIRPGEKIPVDGFIINGTTYIDESMVTGESVPVHKTTGAKVIGGTMNKYGSIEVRTTAVGIETVVAQIARLVEEAQNSRASIQSLADKISAVFVPVVIGIAIATFLAWYLLAGTPFSDAMVKSIAVLIIACPCALGLATPTAIVVGMGRGAADGILVKDIASLERLRNVNKVVIDKTGTLTEGKPAVLDLICLNGFHEQTVLPLAASLESKSEHPLSDAIVRYAAGKKIVMADVESFIARPGMGISGIVQGAQVVVGNIEMMRNCNIDFGRENDLKTLKSQSGNSSVLISVDGTLAGTIMISDPLKESSKGAIEALRKMNIRTMMLTGDTAATANAVAKEAGIDNVVAEVMPREKAERVKALQSEGNVIAMVGDGINDAPGLAQADVGIAMAQGTDLAIETADITLMRNNLFGVVDAIILSKKIYRTMKQNFFWAFIYNIVGIPVAAFGLLHPILAAGAMAGSSVSVVSNSLRLRKAKLSGHSR